MGLSPFALKFCQHFRMKILGWHLPILSDVLDKFSERRSMGQCPRMPGHTFLVFCPIACSQGQCISPRRRVTQVPSLSNEFAPKFFKLFLICCYNKDFSKYCNKEKAS
jgi:hypothetical protein